MSDSDDPARFVQRVALTLKRELYCNHGHPWWALDPWLQIRLVKLVTEDWGRFRKRDRFTTFRTQLDKDAAKHRARLVAPEYDGPKNETWERLLPLLGEAINELERPVDIPNGWDWSEKEKKILAALEYVDNELAPQQMKIFHCRAINGLTEAQTVAVLFPEARTIEDVAARKSTVGSTLCQTWRAMEDDKVDVSSFGWFLNHTVAGTNKKTDKQADKQKGEEGSR